MEVENNAVDLFNTDLKRVNDILNNIRDLNTHIRKCDIHGSPALEMRDERNRLIDELSQYVKIDVEYSNEHIGPAVDVEKLSIKIAGTYPGQYMVDGIYSTQLVHKEVTPPAVDNYDLFMSPLTDIKGNIKTDYLSVAMEDVIPGMVVTGVGGDEFEIDPIIAKMTGDSYSWNSEATEEGYQTQYLLRRIPGETPDAPAKYVLTATQVQLSTQIDLHDNSLYGALQASREFLTESGEFSTLDYIAEVDSKAATKRGVRYYKHALDLLAKKFADTMNTANNAFRYTYDHDAGKYYYVDDDGNPITGPDGELMEKKAEDALTDEEIEYLTEHGSRAEKCGNLFSVSGDSDDGENITAANISISAGWASGDIQIVKSYAVVTGTGITPTTDNTNILHMLQLMDEDMDYLPTQLIGGTKDEAFFTGSFNEMLGNISAVLGNDQNSTKIMLDNYYASAVDLDTSRDSVSSVDLNDETVNMIQYQKSYSAACRLMTALDETLDKLINGTGIAGR